MKNRANYSKIGFIVMTILNLESFGVTTSLFQHCARTNLWVSILAFGVVSSSVFDWLDLHTLQLHLQIQLLELGLKLYNVGSAQQEFSNVLLVQECSPQQHSMMKWLCFFFSLLKKALDSYSPYFYEGI